VSASCFKRHIYLPIDETAANVDRFMH